MKHTRTITIPAPNREETVRVTCDACGNEIEDPGDYKVRDIVISIARGDRYPECGSVVRQEFDCCYSCFVNCIATQFREGPREVDCGY